MTFAFRHIYDCGRILGVGAIKLETSQPQTRTKVLEKDSSGILAGPLKGFDATLKTTKPKRYE